MIKSDVHLNNKEEGITCFSYTFPDRDDLSTATDANHDAKEHDTEGDLIVVKRKRKRRLKISHHVENKMDDVGMQVWKGALYMNDFLIENYHKILLPFTLILDVGSGTGLNSILLGQFAQNVVDISGINIIATDYTNLILANIGKNIKLNNVEKYVKTRHLNLFQYCKRYKDGKDDRKEEIKEEYIYNPLKDVTNFESVYIIGSDIIYGEHLTTAFFDFLEIIATINCKVKVCNLISLWVHDELYLIIFHFITRF